MGPLSSGRPPRAVIFDAFGTLLQIRNGRNPYRRLIKAGIEQGRRPRPDDSRQIMTNPWGLRETAEAFGIQVPDSLMRELESDLSAEVAGIEPFPDALAAIDALHARGLSIAVCSNLALPYGAAIQRHFPTLDAVLSFAVGAMKPEPAIYATCCQILGMPPAESVMVGDSDQCDRIGPGAVGIRGFLLDRSGQGELHDLEQFAVQLMTPAGARTMSSSPTPL